MSKKYMYTFVDENMLKLCEKYSIEKYLRGSL